MGTETHPETQKTINGIVIARIVVALAALSLAGALVWGVIDGRLGFSAPAEAASESGSPFASASGGGDAAEGGVLALSADRRSILVLSPEEGTVRGEIELPAQAAEIAPTPGGVSVFVTYLTDGDRAGIDVYSTTEYGLQERIDLGAIDSELDEEAPQHLSFSENGDTLLVTYRESDRVSIFSHSMRELSNPYHFTVADSEGLIVRNRRATRLFRRTGEGLASIYAQNGAIIETFDVAGRHWRFNAEYSHLWGIGDDGRPRVVAERSGAVTMLPWQAARDAGAGALAVDEGRVAILRDGGESVSVLDAQSAEEIGTVSLPFAAERISESGTGVLWAVAADGRVAVIDPIEAAVTAQLETALASVAALAPSIVKQEGNFACF